MFNMKILVRALEDIAEIEQEKIFELEKALEEQLIKQKEQEDKDAAEKPDLSMHAA
jgi:hypothetical protein